MKQQYFLAAIFISLFLWVLSYSAYQEGDAVSVKNFVFCTGVEERQPVGQDTVFSNTTERIYCYTEFTSSTGSETVHHVWYHGEEEWARVAQNIKSTRWRSWSSKRIVPSWSGNWRVDIVAADGSVLASKSFTVRKDGE